MRCISRYSMRCSAAPRGSRALRCCSAAKRFATKRLCIVRAREPFAGFTERSSPRVINRPISLRPLITRRNAAKPARSFKGVAADRAHGAFQGRITVRPGAQKVDAHMLSRNLLLGRRAAIDTKPELEIFADDVKCSHGAAVGDLDEAALFYLLTRGIPREQARRILIEAFIREAVEIVEDPALRERLLARLARRLAVLEE